MLIDAHAHICDDKLYPQAEDVVNAFRSAGVGRVIDSGWNIESSLRSCSLAERFDEIYFAAGVHPCNCAELDENAISSLKQLLTHKKCVAVGEIGFDYHYPETDKKGERRAFELQLEIADHFALPVVIHTRDSAGDTLEFLKAHKTLLKHGVLLHCFCESAEIMKELNKLDVFYSFGGVITFKNAKNIYTLTDVLPRDRFLTETDCPYLTPHPFRGGINQPKYIPLIRDKLAEVLSMSAEAVDSAVTAAAKALFGKLGAAEAACRTEK